MTRFVRIAMGVAAVFYGVFIWRTSFTYEGTRYFTLFDDAMISMTYARNFANGHGLVWNVGEPPVEGFTNPLWTLLMAGLHALPISDSHVALGVSVVSAALVVGCMGLAATIAQRLRPSSTIAPGAAAAVLVGAYYPLVYWALRGMEVGLVTFLVLAGVLLAMRIVDAADEGRERVTRDAALLCVVFAAGVMAREDFVVPAGVIGLWLLVRLDGARRWRVAAALVGVTAAVLAVQIGARLAYYGEPLPNTYYLKVANQPLVARWWRGALTLVVVVLADGLVLIGVVLAGLRGDRRRPGADGAARAGRDRAARWSAPALLLAIAAALAVYSVYVGGDAWEWARLANRYITPAAVLLLVLVATVVEQLARRIRRSRRPWAGVAIIVVPSLLAVLFDSFLGVVLHRQLGEHLGATPTRSDAAALAVVVLMAALVVAWMLGSRPLPTRLAKGAFLPVLLAIAVGVATTGSAWRLWLADGGFYVEKNRGATAYGLELGRLTDPDASIAVIWAGAPIYFAQRDGVDLLGKMDPVIAHGPHHEGVPQYPGHDKFDFDHSIGALRPDVIAQYAWFREADVDRLVDWGYLPMRFKDGVADGLYALDVPRALLWVRSDSNLVDRDALEAVSVDDAKRISVERS